MAVWVPDARERDKTLLAAFKKFIQDKEGANFSEEQSFYQWTVDNTLTFWSSFWDFARLTGAAKGTSVLQEAARFQDCRFFPEARLNYAEQLLQGPEAQEAIVFRGEDRFVKRMTYGDLKRQVHSLQSALKEMGLGSGDRVAALLPNIPEAVALMVAVTSLGAIWSSCSPDFGVEGILDRFQQIQPKLMITADGALYKGRGHDCLKKSQALLSHLPSVEHLIVVPYLDPHPDVSALPHPLFYSDLVAAAPAHPLTFQAVPFDHPLFILFSSGTTGKPKCIVHGHGGTLLQHLKEHRLHCDLRPGSRLFYYTTTGWMMWNWLVSGLASQATLLLYDGSPFHPGPEALWDYAVTEGCTHFGTSAKYIDALDKCGFVALDHYDLDPLRMILSTGSPLIPTSFDYVYKKIAPQVCLASISGGTDILSCFALGDITAPVYRGELQTRGFGMAVEVFDDTGQPVQGQKGELVCTKPFPSMPVCFWNDPGGEKYAKAYFETYPNCWHHGDFVELTETGGLIIYGRSDTVLNPGGVRIGTAEIYRQVDPLEEIEGSLVIGQQWQDDVRIVLFVHLKSGLTLNNDLRSKIRQQIQEKATPRHVPSRIIQVPDIPRTLSGKVVELAVTHIVHGRDVQSKEALANPEALNFFKDLPDLRE